MKEGRELDEALNKVMEDYCGERAEYVTVRASDLQKHVNQVHDLAFEDGKNKGINKCFWVMLLCWLVFRILEVIEAIVNK